MSKHHNHTDNHDHPHDHPHSHAHDPAPHDLAQDDLNTTPDGDFQTYRAEDGKFIRDHFFGRDERTAAMVKNWSDEDIWGKLRRGGLDYQKLYAAYKAATESEDPRAGLLDRAIAGGVAMLAALCYAELAAAVPTAGSSYTYAYTTIGEIFAWIIAWDLILEFALGAAVVARGWSGYLQESFGLPSQWFGEENSVVNLGAGLDARPYRLDLPAGVDVEIKL